MELNDMLFNGFWVVVMVACATNSRSALNRNGMQPLKPTRF